MLLTVIGWVFVLLGLFFLIRPGFLRNRLRKKGIKRIRRLIIAATLFLAITLATAGSGLGGIYYKLLILVGLILIIKSVLLLNRKTSEALTGWFSLRPLWVFRGIALIYLVSGLFFIYFR